MVLDGGSQDWFDQSDACYNLDVTVEPRAPVEDVVSSFAAGTTTDWKSMLHSCLQDREAMLDGRALDLSMSSCGNKINAAVPITAPSVKHEHAPMLGDGQLERDEKKTARLQRSWRENMRAVPVDTRRRGVHQQQELDDDVDELIALIN
eukprot:g9257.t1